MIPNPLHVGTRKKRSCSHCRDEEKSLILNSSAHTLVVAGPELRQQVNPQLCAFSGLAPADLATANPMPPVCLLLSCVSGQVSTSHPCLLNISIFWSKTVASWVSNWSFNWGNSFW